MFLSGTIAPGKPQAIISEETTNEGTQSKKGSPPQSEASSDGNSTSKEPKKKRIPYFNLVACQNSMLCIKYLNSLHGLAIY